MHHQFLCIYDLIDPDPDPIIITNLHPIPVTILIHALYTRIYVSFLSYFPAATLFLSLPFSFPPAPIQSIWLGPPISKAAKLKAQAPTPPAIHSLRNFFSAHSVPISVDTMMPTPTPYKNEPIRNAGEKKSKQRKIKSLYAYAEREKTQTPVCKSLLFSNSFGRIDVMRDCCTSQGGNEVRRQSQFFGEVGEN